ncbi:beta-amyrin 11-oxidase-like [Senna tora]|uniref:Beta-amyrin 11-oxidase-like n=1 Tax=Senna tora TaxID=362788 RepID=A0A834WS32_9FABA|nr:beta-amyrin 11-oxidase-like [Senna tora]
MEVWFWMLGGALGVYIFVFGIVRNINQWVYAERVKHKVSHPLPPGHMGWPLLGNFLSFVTAFKSPNPESFINNLVSRYGGSGIYKTHMFGSPSVIVCKSELCRKVLTDDEHFKLGYPEPMLRLVGTRTFDKDSVPQHKRIRRLTTSPIVGHVSLAMYVERIEDIMVNSLEEWASMSTKTPLILLNELKDVTFKIILHILMGSHNHSISKIGALYHHVLHGLFALPINLPGFAYHKALAARKNLERAVQSILNEKRMMMKRKGEKEGEKGLLDIWFDVEDENGEKLGDEDMVDLLIGFLFAGHETSAYAIMWSIIYLTNHPHIMNKAKQEQEEILKTRPQQQKGLNLNEIKQMVFLAKVIDETLRRATIAFSIIRKAKVDVNINGYSIPKGWKVLVWLRAVHLDPENYSDPLQFDPSRWDDYAAKPGTYIPFGAGMRLCPGLDLVKLEMSIFLHYFLLHYK